MHRRHRLSICAAIAICAALGLLPCRSALAGGHLRMMTPVSGTLRLEGVLGRQESVFLETGETMIWELPVGEYAAYFDPADLLPGDRDARAQIAFGIVRIFDRLVSPVLIDPAAGAIVQSADPDGAGGTAMLLDHELISALPGDKTMILDGLDTRVRWRSSASVAGVDVAVAAERRGILPGAPSSLGPSWISLSPTGSATSAAALNLSYAPYLPAYVAGEAARAGSTAGGDSLSPGEMMAARNIGIRASARGSSYQGNEVDGGLLLRRFPLVGNAVRASATAHYADLEDAYPRSEADGTLPHNDEQRLDVTAHLEIGAPAPAALVAERSTDADDNWGIALDLASRGLQRNHYLKIYSNDLDHAPYEETGLFTTRGMFTIRLAPQTRAELFAGYTEYLTQLFDGLYRGNLTQLASGLGNGGADTTGLYWQGDTGDVLKMPHVFDYLHRKFTATLEAGATFSHAAPGSGALWRATFTGTRQTYRRYEHFAPTSAAGNLYGDALYIGYDRTGEDRNDTPHRPGEPLTLRGDIELQRKLGQRWHFDGAVGGYFFDSRDSALVSLTNPPGADLRLDAADFKKSPRHLRFEGSLALRREIGSRNQAWGLGYRRAVPLPLEALYSPRAHLAVESPEGIMGNPALEPEMETGAELGFSRLMDIAPRPIRVTVAAYAARLDDALSLTYAHVLSARDTLLATCENGGTLRQYGLHLELTAGRASDRFWARASYDLSRTESNQFEPPLLDDRWAYPDLAQGEYESEGYASALGGIFDPLAEGAHGLQAGSYRPANLDRTHQVSLALIMRDVRPAESAGFWNAVTRGWALGALARLASGRPYTQIFLHPEGIPPHADRSQRGPDDPAWSEPLSIRNGQRMPATFTLDLAATRRIPLGTRRFTITLEALNLIGLNNVSAVYRATGKSKDDGCLDNPSCHSELPATTTEQMYQERLRDPIHFDRPLVLRLAVGLEII